MAAHPTRGLPLCLAGVTHPADLNKEIEDHDRRRKELRELRLRRLHAGGSSQRRAENGARDNRSGDADEDLAAVLRLLNSLSFSTLSSCTAKAA